MPTTIVGMAPKSRNSIFFDGLPRLGLATCCLQQVPRFDFEITVHKRRGHAFGKDIDGQHALPLEIDERLMTPRQHVGRGGAVVCPLICL